MGEVSFPQQGRFFNFWALNVIKENITFLNKHKISCEINNSISFQFKRKGFFGVNFILILSLFLFSHSNVMYWAEQHNIILCREVMLWEVKEKVKIWRKYCFCISALAWVCIKNKVFTLVKKTYNVINNNNNINNNLLRFKEQPLIFGDQKEKKRLSPNWKKV